MASAAVAGTKRSFAAMTMSNDITTAMSTILDKGQESLVTHSRSNTSVEGTRNTICIHSL
jgi:hypothetical protein